MDVKYSFIFNMRHAAHIRQHSFCGCSRAFLAGASNQDREFVSAEARNDIVAPDTASQLVTYLANQAIAGRMPTCIIDVLKLIQIDKEQRTTVPVPLHAFDFFLEFFDKPPPIE